MSEVMEIIKRQNERSEFKVGVVLASCLVALSFFAVGLIYGQAFDTVILFKLLLAVSAINITVFVYLFKRLNALSNT